ncbi:hypothetical protein FXV77_09155 [Sphingobacterium phlebotomi]|uniref:DUF5018 domain-containing protein n=1 Tax=Sphingobacterium phlebotomi TaxID=2605433 RepID=A0A5D4HA00_9SPHI|nr:hypothetical protein [Sphingobacterium phlebotomi]TYR36659.1 hypothetical protein FXV77_09155 [Sphingobacterium phlebotomi]
MKKLTSPTTVLFFILLIAAGCSKTEELPPLNQSRILSFKVPTADGEIIGAVDESDKTITLYLPFYYQFSVIDPEIKLSDGASLLEESVTVDVLDNGTIYTVVGADHSKTSYTLTIHLQQVSPLIITEPSTADQTAIWSIGDNRISIKANFHTTDPTLIKASLVDESGHDHPFIANTGYGPAGVVASIGADGKKTYSYGSLQIPPELLPGMYHIKVSHLALNATTTYPVQLVWGRPASFVYAPVTIGPGETFTLESASTAIHDIREAYFTIGGEKKMLEILSQDTKKVIIRVPDDTPTGTHIPSIVCGEFEPSTPGWWGITITK